MVYFTGDIHGSPLGIRRFCIHKKLTCDDILVILGDVGANYYGDYRDDRMKEVLANLEPTIFCIHGNHEQRPEHIPGYQLKDWHGGKVWVQDAFSNLLFARDGDIYEIGKYRYLVIGGAYSVDKFYRLQNGYGWWADEQPSTEIKTYVERQIQEKAFDVILSHTCPYRYEPTEMFLPMVEQSSVDDSTEKWLNQIEKSVQYLAWFCGHWHTDKHIDRIHFLFHDFETEDDILTE